MKLFRKPSTDEAKGDLKKLLETGVLTPEHVEEVLALVKKGREPVKTALESGSAARKRLDRTVSYKMSNAFAISPEGQTLGRSLGFPDSDPEHRVPGELRRLVQFDNLSSPSGPNQFGVFLFPVDYSNEQIVDYILTHNGQSAAERILAYSRNQIGAKGVGLAWLATDADAEALPEADPEIFIQAMDRVVGWIRQGVLPNDEKYAVIFGYDYQSATANTLHVFCQIDVRDSPEAQLAFLKREVPVVIARTRFVRAGRSV